MTVHTAAGRARSTTTAGTGLAGILGGATLMLPAPEPGQPGYLAFNTANVVAFLLLLVTTLGLWRLGVVGRSRLGHIGLAVTCAALVGFAAVEVATRFVSTVGEVAHPIIVPMAALGMTVSGIAVLRAGIWRGWVRVTPLLCGVVPLLIQLPLVILFGPSGLVIALPWVTWVLLGIAQLSTAVLDERSHGL